MVSLHINNIFLVIFASSNLILNNKFNFGLFENSPRLKLLLQEDQIFSSHLQNLSATYQDDTLTSFLQFQSINDREDSLNIQHPLKVYHLIKNYALLLPDLISGVKLEDLRQKIQQHQNETQVISTINEDDFQKTLGGIVLMIYSFNLDLEKFSKGIIPANQHGNGNGDLISDKHLYADDLCNLATKAMEYGFLETAADLLKKA